MNKPAANKSPINKKTNKDHRKQTTKATIRT